MHVHTKQVCWPLLLGLGSCVVLVECMQLLVTVSGLHQSVNGGQGSSLPQAVLSAPGIQVLYAAKAAVNSG
jgi:hypothetical protein